MGVVVYRVPKQRSREEILRDFRNGDDTPVEVQMELLLDIRDLLRAIALREGVRLE